MLRQSMMRFASKPSPTLLVRQTCSFTFRPVMRQSTTTLRCVSQPNPRQNAKPVVVSLVGGWRRQQQHHRSLHQLDTCTASAASVDQASTSSLQNNEGESTPLNAVVSYCIVNFYHLVDIERPHAVVAEHKRWLEDKDVRGRIYISEQGINAQYGGKTEDAVAYVEWLKEQPLFQGLFYSVDLVDDHMYPKLRLKYRPNLISLAGGMASLPITKPESRAVKVPPKQWKEWLEKGKDGKKPLVLDVRNSYEWDAGHFVGAERPLEDNFHETPTEATPDEVPEYLANADPDTPVMMYCTGGIRCDVYSTYLRQKGFDNLYTLEGGIQNYMKEEGLDYWNGSLYVFDGRMAIRPNKDEQAELVAAAPCSSCGGQAVLPHANCANIDCNKLFIACTECKVQYKGCCCEGCMDAPRLLRPVKLKGTYGNWSEYVSESDEEAVKKVTEGRTRISRRRQRQQALREREKLKRADKVERRQLAKEAMAAAEQEGQGAAGQDADQVERQRRLDRLAELKAQLLTAKTSSSTSA